MFRASMRGTEPSNEETSKVSWRSPAMGGRDNHRWETVREHRTSRDYLCKK